jgi:hypothetical protein
MASVGQCLLGSQLIGRIEIVKQDGTKVITYTPLRTAKRRTEAQA